MSYFFDVIKQLLYLHFPPTINHQYLMRLRNFMHLLNARVDSEQLSAKESFIIMSHLLCNKYMTTLCLASGEVDPVVNLLTGNLFSRLIDKQLTPTYIIHNSHCVTDLISDNPITREFGWAVVLGDGTITVLSSMHVLNRSLRYDASAKLIDPWRRPAQFVFPLSACNDGKWRNICKLVCDNRFLGSRGTLGEFSVGMNPEDKLAFAAQWSGITNSELLYFKDDSRVKDNWHMLSDAGNVAVAAIFELQQPAPLRLTWIIRTYLDKTLFLHFVYFWRDAAICHKIFEFLMMPWLVILFIQINYFILLFRIGLSFS